MNNELPLISVIIPVYNVEKYLDRCLNSVINQTYKNLEIILVDDGSPDKCPQMCDEWAEKDDRIMVIHKENGGLSSARNAALDIMRGEYLTFVDSDDYISDDMIEVLFNRLLIDSSDLAHCNHDYVDDNGLADEYEQENLLEIPDEVLSHDEALHKLSDSYYWLYILSCSKLYKRELFNGFRFPINKEHEDELTTHLIFDKCDKVSIISDKLYHYYRANNKSITASKSLGKFDVFDGYCARIDFYIEKSWYEDAARTLQIFLERMYVMYDLFKFSNNSVCKEYRKNNLRFRHYFNILRKKDKSIKFSKRAYLFSYNSTMCYLLDRIYSKIRVDI